LITGSKKNFYAIFGTFGRYVTNLRGTFVKNVKKSPKATHPTGQWRAVFDIAVISESFLKINPPTQKVVDEAGREDRYQIRQDKGKGKMDKLKIIKKTLNSLSQHEY
jgi:hypothetical protein